MTLATLALGIGILLLVSQACAVWQPASYGAALRKFPRSTTWGYFLMGLGTLWFLSILHRETISDFAAWKRYLLLGFGLLGLFSCLYVRDFLAVRGLAVVLLLASKLVVDVARWHDSSARLLMVLLAYAGVIAAMWLIVSPWRLRDWIAWQTDNLKRIRLGGTVALVLSLVILLLGLAIY
jgi:hypothetical protein